MDEGDLALVGIGRSPFVHLSSLPRIRAILSLCLPHPVALSPVGNLSQAVENVLSVLLFYPEDEAAKDALNQYQAQLGEPRPGLGPREVPPPPAPLPWEALNQTYLSNYRDSAPSPILAQAL